MNNNDSVKYLIADSGNDCVGILCKSQKHGDALNNVLTKRALTSKEFCGYLMWLCGNSAGAIDSVGRTTLHLAASRGLKDVVEWLINCKHANIDVKDTESAYTPLHRSIFYGQIYTAVYLIKNGANMQLIDRDCLTAIDHAMKDRLTKIEYSLNHNCEVYMWGSNSNYTLGMQQTKPYPELLSKQNLDIPIKQVCLRKFHCVMVSKDGNVYSCGHGQGGRLGLGELNTAMKPTQIKFQARTQSQTNVCKQAAIGHDHSMFLMDSSVVWTCGLNTYRVLGFNPPPEMLLHPKPLPEFKTTPILGICAGRFHSVAWCSTAIYTWGFNAGQLGHEVTIGNMVLTPKQVVSLRGSNFCITNVAASDGATVVVVERGDIYVLHEYQCRKIASRQLNIEKVTVIGGHLDEKLDKNLLKERNPLKVLVITNRGNVLLWQESSLQLTRCIFSINRALIVTDAILNKANILFVTADGEAYQGIIKERKIKSIDITNQKPTKKAAFHKFLDKNECELIVVQRLRNVHRAVSISSDNKGRNFAVLQNDPRIYLQSCRPTVESSIEKDFLNLLHNSDEMDPIHDVVFKIKYDKFPAHRYIIAGSSKLLYSKIVNGNSKTVEIENIQSDIFTNILEFMYTKSCMLLKKYRNSICDGDNDIIEDKKDSKLKTIRSLQAAAKQLGVTELYNVIQMRLNGTTSKHNELKFSRNAFPDTYDVKVKCSNGQHIHAHKCVLAGRLDYFNNLFAMRWNEDMQRTIVGLPYPPNIVQVVIDFLYTDTVDNFNSDNEIDHACNVLIVADQLLIIRLKEICEVKLTKKLTLRNVWQLIQFADMYQCKILKNCCMEFICLNLSAILESRCLENLDDSILQELSEYYWNYNTKLQARVITPYSDAPSDEQVRIICENNPINMEQIDEEIDKQLLKLNHKRKIFRTRKLSEKSKMHNDSVNSNISEHDSSLNSTDNALFTLENLIENDIPKTEWITVNNSHQKLVQARLRANNQMKEEIDLELTMDNFTKLTHTPTILTPQQSLNNTQVSPFDSSQWNNFPELNSPRTRNEHFIDVAKSPPKHDILKQKIQKLSQKQRKKLFVENNNLATQLDNLNLKSNKSDTVAESVSTSKQNPWKKIDLIPDENINKQMYFPDIIADEQKKKENFTKMKAKPLLLTQIEDRAIQDLKRFYNIDNVVDEYLTIKRVEQTDIAAPQWVTHGKK